MPESVLTVLKFCFLALLYLFLFRVVQVVVRELRAPEADEVADGRRDRKTRKGVRLRILEPQEHEGELYQLGEEITVGRGGGCSIVLPDDHYVSTLHARVFRRGDEVLVEDLGSRNGTYLNGSPVTSATRLRRGDRVQFGQTVAEVVR
ncbi:MAG TPA: FHA domain-containing protein [Acidimicrobiia bacterium]|nr:FHA domain-containing protein [Acidimicrobiia bacterium]